MHARDEDNPARDEINLQMKDKNKRNMEEEKERKKMLIAVIKKMLNNVLIIRKSLITFCC